MGNQSFNGIHALSDWLPYFIEIASQTKRSVVHSRKQYKSKGLIMARCEDYPCCGHEPNGCPNRDGSFNCASCGKKLPKDSTSAVCTRCHARWRQEDDFGDYESESGE